MLFSALVCQPVLCDEFHEAATSVTNNNDAIDLLAGTVNGKQLNNMTIDDVTDMYGRPSDVIVINGAYDYTYKHVCFTQNGLIFIFNTDKAKCVGVNIFTAKTSDKQTDNEYHPYKGSISRGVTGDWKAKKILEVFSDSKCKDIYEDNKANRKLNASLDTSCAASRSSGRAGCDTRCSRQFFQATSPAPACTTPHGFLHPPTPQSLAIKLPEPCQNTARGF
jgi:hypothetical protein